jgi:hypothetical protein
MKAYHLCVVALSSTLAGCASTQLNYNTLEIASTVASLQTKQVLSNISAFIDDPDTLPAQVAVNSGSITTTNSVTPSITESLTKSNAVLGAVSATRTAVQSATQAGTNQSTQSWSVAPVSDGDNLARLRALYMFAVTGDANVLASYPKHIVFYARAPNTPTNSPYLDPVLENSRHQVWNGHAPNRRLCRNWLYYSGNSWNGIERPVPADQVAIPLGSYGNHELFTTQSARVNKCLAEFVLFVLDAAGETASPSGATGTAGKPKSGAAPAIVPFTPDTIPPAAR